VTADFTVVGGGVGGLVVARRLARAGATVVLHETADRLGGSVAHHTVGGLALDSGAESFATRGGTVAALAEELGLGGDVVAPAALGSWLHRAEGAVPMPATSVLGIPGVPLARDVVDVVGWRAAWRALLDELLPGTVADGSRTLGELVRRRMGDRMLEQLVAPVTLGVHSAHPDDLPVDRVAPGLRAAMRREGSLAKGVRDLRERAPAGAAVQGIRGGVHRLVDALAADLRDFGVDIRLSSRVPRADAPGPDDARIVWAAGGTEAGTRVTLVTLVLAPAALDGAPRGTGVLVVPGTPGVSAKALTHATAKWPWLAEDAGGRHVVRLSYAAPASIDVARHDAAELLGVPVPPTSVEDWATITWTRSAPATEADDGIVRVGESAAGTGLANVIGHANRTADELLATTAP
jgi:oxygen-dependent protoporphyrinogen oxidase